MKREDYAGVPFDEESPEHKGKASGRKEWRMISFVIDRILFIIFLVIALIITIAIYAL